MNNLSQLANLIIIYQDEIELLKNKIIELAKKTKYFKVINSIYGIGEFSTAIIIAELGDINRFNNIKELTAFCGLDPSIKQSGRSVNVHGGISKCGNKYARKMLYVVCVNIVRLSAKLNNGSNIGDFYKKNVMKVNIITQQL